MLAAWPNARIMSLCNGQDINQEVIKLTHTYVYSCVDEHMGDLAGFLHHFTFAEFESRLRVYIEGLTSQIIRLKGIETARQSSSLCCTTN